MAAGCRALYDQWLRREFAPKLAARGFKRRGAGWSRYVDGNALVVLVEARTPCAMDPLEVRVSYGVISAVGSPVAAAAATIPSVDNWTTQYDDVRAEEDGSPWLVTDEGSLTPLRERLLPQLLGQVDELGRTGTSDRAVLGALRFGKLGGSSEFLRLLSAFRIATALPDTEGAEWAASGLRRMWRSAREPVFKANIENAATKLGLDLQATPPPGMQDPR